MKELTNDIIESLKIKKIFYIIKQIRLMSKLKKKKENLLILINFKENI